MSTREERIAALEARLGEPKAHQEQVDARRRHNEKKAALKLADAALLDKVWEVVSDSFDARFKSQATSGRPEAGNTRTKNYAVILMNRALG